MFHVSWFCILEFIARLSYGYCSSIFCWFKWINVPKRECLGHSRLPSESNANTAHAKERVVLNWRQFDHSFSVFRWLLFINCIKTFISNYQNSLYIFCLFWQIHKHSFCMRNRLTFGPRNISAQVSCRVCYWISNLNSTWSQFCFREKIS